jgi:hypothetical protein
MKYDDNHIRDFEGAIGICTMCGLKITLDWSDKPLSLHLNAWSVKCPHCNNLVSCYKKTELSDEEV